MEHVVFDGVELTSSELVALVKSRPMSKLDVQLEHVSGTDGFMALGASILPEPVTVKLVAPNAGQRERRALARWLGSVLYAKEPKKLSLSSDDGLWCYAMLAKRPDLSEFVTSGSVMVSWQPMHAAMYGQHRSEVVPSGGSVTVNVRGTYPTPLRITAAAATRDASTGLWGLLLDNDKFLQVPLTTTSTLDISCEDRTCIVGGYVTLPTLESDWLEVDNGTHVLENYLGGGACTVEWYERWL